MRTNLYQKKSIQKLKCFVCKESLLKSITLDRIKLPKDALTKITFCKTDLLGKLKLVNWYSLMAWWWICYQCRWIKTVNFDRYLRHLHTFWCRFLRLEGSLVVMKIDSSKLTLWSIRGLPSKEYVPNIFIVSRISMHFSLANPFSEWLKSYRNSHTIETWVPITVGELIAHISRI